MSDELKNAQANWLEVTAADGHEFWFSTAESALQYIEREAGKWTWLLGESQQQQPHGSHVLHEFISRLVGLNPSSPKPQVDPQGYEQWLKARVQSYLTFIPALHERGALQAYLLGIFDREPREAFWTLHWLIYRAGRNKDLMRQLQIRDCFMAAGMMNAWIWERPSDDGAIRQQLDELTKLAGVRTDAIATASHQAQGAADAMRALQRDSEAEKASFLKQLQDSLTQRSEELAGLYASAETKMDDEWRALHRTYDEKLALAAPSKYWAGKQRGHKRSAIGFGLALGVVAVLGIVGLAVLGSAVFGGAQITVVPKWSQAITVTAAVVLLVWTLKTLIRLTLSHAHLEIDANERRIMILSYLAMLKKSDTTDEQRTALFAAIFRPTGNGLISDESVPVPLLDLLKGK